MFFLEVLPALPEGVVVHIHDIFLPFDYRPDGRGGTAIEQYLLAVALLNGSRLSGDLALLLPIRSATPISPPGAAPVAPNYPRGEFAVDDAVGAVAVARAATS